MTNKYRLSSTTYNRETEEEKEDLQKIIFLSVEGNVTEKEYFDGVSSNREKLGIDSRIDVEVLKRRSNDTNSAPQQVIELLEEYIRLREYGKEKLIEDIPEEFVEKYGIEFIQQYLYEPNELPKKKRNLFMTDLMKIGYDVNYRKYLNKYNSKLDEFCILIDRDMQTHSEVNMQECIKYCKEKGYKCYIANPCFEFWLLLHLSDVEIEYGDRMHLIKENAKVSDSHTYVSKEVSDKAHHGKCGINFKRNYMPRIDIAIQRAKRMPSDENDLVNCIGCNLWKLLEDMKRSLD